MKIVLILLFLVSASVIKSQNTKLDTVTFVEEIQPEFIGGPAAMYRFLGEQVKYPQDAREAKIEGKVYVKFIVRKTGEITDVKIVKSLYPSIDAEAIRAIKTMPLWRPGEQKGEKVDVWFTLPIAFRIGGKKKKKNNKKP